MHVYLLYFFELLTAKTHTNKIHKRTICTHPSTTAGRADRQMRQELGKINAVMSEHCANLAPYQFLTAFSQLISRVCHSSDEVFTVLMTIVAKVFLAYPQQAMWLMAAVSKVCVGDFFVMK